MLELAQATQRPMDESVGNTFLARIDALLPELHARAGETERLGRIPSDIVTALTAS